jgi:hypothetical protein
MKNGDTISQSARRAALFGSASGVHRSIQPIQRSQADRNPDDVDLTAAALLAADRTTLLTGSLAQLEQQVVEILAASKQRSVADLLLGEASADGSLAIDSMSAVFVCRIVERVGGPGGWTKLRGNCEPKDFVSVRSVALLVGRLRRAAVAA